MINKLINCLAVGSVLGFKNMWWEVLWSLNWSIGPPDHRGLIPWNENKLNLNTKSELSQEYQSNRSNQVITIFGQSYKQYFYCIVLKIAKIEEHKCGCIWPLSTLSGPYLTDEYFQYFDFFFNCSYLDGSKEDQIKWGPCWW